MDTHWYSIDNLPTTTTTTRTTDPPLGAIEIAGVRVRQRKHIRTEKLKPERASPLLGLCCSLALSHSPTFLHLSAPFCCCCSCCLLLIKFRLFCERPQTTRVVVIAFWTLHRTQTQMEVGRGKRGSRQVVAAVASATYMCSSYRSITESLTEVGHQLDRILRLILASERQAREGRRMMGRGGCKRHAWAAQLTFN